MSELPIGRNEMAAGFSGDLASHPVKGVGIVRSQIGFGFTVGQNAEVPGGCAPGHQEKGRGKSQGPVQDARNMLHGVSSLFPQNN